MHYHYTGNGKCSLRLHEGVSFLTKHSHVNFQRLIVTEEDTGDGWTKVKQSGGVTEGFVPTSYIRLL